MADPTTPEPSEREFVVAMPDNALAPNIPRGTRLIFNRAATPSPGDGVLVRDAAGGLYIRRYCAGLSGDWIAQALNGSYATLVKSRDGLMLLAAMTGRCGSQV